MSPETFILMNAFGVIVIKLLHLNNIFFFTSLWRTALYSSAVLQTLARVKLCVSGVEVITEAK